MDHDLVAGLPVGDARADLPDDPGGVGAADVVAVLGVVAVAEHGDGLAERRPDVVEVHAGGHHAHDHLERLRLGNLDLLDLEGVLGLALALLADHPRRHRLGQRAGLHVELRDLRYVNSHFFDQLLDQSLPGAMFVSRLRRFISHLKGRGWPALQRQVPVRPATTLKSPMEASEKPQLPLDGIDRRQRPRDRRPPGGRAARDRRTSAPRGSSASAPRPASRRRETVDEGDRDRRPGARQRGDGRQRRLRARRVRAPRRRAPRAARRDARGRRRAARRAHRRALRRRRATARFRRTSRSSSSEALEEQRLRIARLFSAEDGANPLTDFKAAVVRGFKALDERQQNEGEANRKRIEELQRADDRAARARGGRRARRRRGRAGTAQGPHLRGAGARRARADRRRCAATAPPTPAARAPRAAARRATRSSSSAPPTGRRPGAIVFEAKDKKLSKNDAWAELNGGMAARAAGVRRARRRRRGAGPVGPRAADGVRGQQADRRRAIARSPTRSRSRSPTGSPPRGS